MHAALAASSSVGMDPEAALGVSPIDYSRAYFLVDMSRIVPTHPREHILAFFCLVLPAPMGGNYGNPVLRQPPPPA